jgi:hypothetical protein
VPANPEFGASKHVSTLLLAVTAVEPAIRGAVNLATDDALLDTARERGIDPLEFDAEYENREERLRERFEDRGEVPRILYHRGTFGIEPITFVLGETAEAAARLAADLVENAR